jgi:hypothetical protein
LSTKKEPTPEAHTLTTIVIVPHILFYFISKEILGISEGNWFLCENTKKLEKMTNSTIPLKMTNST